MNKLLENPFFKTEEDRYLEAQSHEIVKEQARTFLRVIKRYVDNIEALKKEIDLHQFSQNKVLKSEAVELALNVMIRRKDHFPEPLIEVVAGLLIDRKENKLARRNNKNINAFTTHQNTNSFNEEGFNVCAVIGGNIAHYLMKGISPKIRLHKNYDGEIHTVFNFFKNDFSKVGEFYSIHEISDINLQKYLKNSQGFVSFFVANFLIADYEFETICVGLLMEKDKSYWSKIHYDKALSYNKSIDLVGSKIYSIKELESISGLRDSNIKYDPSKFQGIEFACEINKVIRDIDETKLRKVIKTSIENIRDVYGNDFLNKHSINQELRNRLMIPDLEFLTEQILENKIVENIRKLQYQLKNIAEEEFTKVIISKGVINKKEELDYKKLFNIDEKLGNLDLFMKFAIKESNFKGVEYLNNLNKSLGFEEIKIDGLSPLEYALKIEQNELAIKMMRAGFVLNKGQQPKTEEEIQNIEAALKNILERRASHPKLRKEKELENISA